MDSGLFGSVAHFTDASVETGRLARLQTDALLRPAPPFAHWIRKAYAAVPGLAHPGVIIANGKVIASTIMPGTDGKWGTNRFVAPSDLCHDMHVAIVTFEAGAVIPFVETHVMAHWHYVLEGKAVYRLNNARVKVGDCMLLPAFCPQSCYAGGPGKLRYLLHKDVNRHMNLRSSHPK